VLRAVRHGHEYQVFSCTRVRRSCMGGCSEKRREHRQHSVSESVLQSNIAQKNDCDSDSEIDADTVVENKGCAGSAGTPPALTKQLSVIPEALPPGRQHWIELPGPLSLAVRKQTVSPHSLQGWECGDLDVGISRNRNGCGPGIRDSRSCPQSCLSRRLKC
jgi:hypothetical protein